MDKLKTVRIAKEKSSEPLPVLVYKHASIIRRKLGNTDLSLQENKAVNLSLAAPKINAILIRPGETFSFWKLVGRRREDGGVALWVSEELHSLSHLLVIL